MGIPVGCELFPWVEALITNVLANIMDNASIKMRAFKIRGTSMENIGEKMKDDIITSIQRNLSRIGTRNPMVGNGQPSFEWHYRDDYFWTGQLWLAYALMGDQSLRNSAEMRKPLLEEVLNTPLWIDLDLGFTFSLTAVANYKLTG